MFDISALKSFFFQQQQLARLDEEKLERQKEDEEARKKRIAQELALSASTASTLLASLKSVFGDKIPEQFKDMMDSLLRADSSRTKPHEIAPELRLLPSAYVTFENHESLAKKAGLSLAFADNYSANDLRKLFEDRKRALIA